MATSTHQIIYRFGRFSLDIGRGSLLSADGVEMQLRPKSFALLQHLVEAAGRLVPREEIMDTLWPNLFVTDDNISQCIRDIRRVLGTGGDQYLRTVPRRGYLFDAEVAIEHRSGRHAPLWGNGDIPEGKTPRGDEHPPISTGPAILHRQAERSTDPPLPGRPSIAVLAFEDLSTDRVDSYSDGVADSIITELSRNRTLFVAARASSFGYKGRSLDVKHIARELGVRYVVDGSIRRDGNRVRITAQLVDGPSGSHIWSERFDVGIDSIVLSRDEIVGRLVRVLSVKLSEDVNRRIEAAPQLDWTPEVLIMRGQAYITRPISRENRHVAIECFEQALRRAPDSVDARLGIALVLIANVADGWSRCAAEDMARGEQLLVDVLHVDDDISWAHTLMGVLRRLQGRLDEALFELEIAVEKAPNHPVALCQLGQTLGFLGRPEQAIPLVEKSLRLAPHDPGTPISYFVLGLCHLLLEHIEESTIFFRKALVGNHWLACSYFGLAAALALSGKLDEAAVAVRQAVEINPELGSLSRLRALPWCRSPDYLALFDRTLGVGLRRAGLPEE